MSEEIKNDNSEIITAEDIKKLLEENLELSRKTHRIVKKINSHIVLEQVLNVIKILVIIVPIILGIIYLPTLLKPYLEQYKQIMDLSGSNGLDISNIQKSLNGLK